MTYDSSMRYFGLGFFRESSPPWTLIPTLKQFNLFSTNSVSYWGIPQKVINSRVYILVAYIYTESN